MRDRLNLSPMVGHCGSAGSHWLDLATIDPVKAWVGQGALNN
jgi:hypothetical protein